MKKIKHTWKHIRYGVQECTVCKCQKISRKENGGYITIYTTRKGEFTKSPSCIEKKSKVVQKSNIVLPEIIKKQDNPKQLTLSLWN